MTAVIKVLQRQQIFLVPLLQKSVLPAQDHVFGDIKSTPHRASCRLVYPSAALSLSLTTADDEDSSRPNQVEQKNKQRSSPSGGGQNSMEIEAKIITLIDSQDTIYDMCKQNTL